MKYCVSQWDMLWTTVRRHVLRKRMLQILQVLRMLQDAQGEASRVLRLQLPLL
jgi:hypothetical protein